MTIFSINLRSYLGRLVRLLFEIWLSRPIRKVGVVDHNLAAFVVLHHGGLFAIFVGLNSKRCPRTIKIPGRAHQLAVDVGLVRRQHPVLSESFMTTLFGPSVETIEIEAVACRRKGAF